MKFLLSWLKEYVELSVHPQTLAERLTMAGLEITSVSGADGDWLFEAEVTPNRPDLLSHLGIAREAAAVLGRPFRFPRWLQREFELRTQGDCPVPVAIEDPQGCRRYVGLVIEGIRVAASPPAIARRLSQLGVRPVNNVVDATNYCLLELGQPLHAFDLDRLTEQKICVRRARKGDTLVTIDGERRALSPELLVIADGHKPVALAGIMGGRESEITGSTRRIFLESAWFDPAVIRRGTRLSRLSSESSYRFERGIDPEGVATAAVRAARAIARSAGGRIRGGLAEAGSGRTQRRWISLKPGRVSEVLGAAIHLSQQRRILEHLGCAVSNSGGRWQVQPPSWRSDVRIAEDLYEEIARLWGYDRCPATLPAAPRLSADNTTLLAEGHGWDQQRRIRQCLASAGFEEIVTYSLIGPADHERVRLGAPGTLALDNPLGQEVSVLRKTFLAGALQTLARNLHRKASESFRLFELGQLYRQDGQVIRQPTGLGLLAAGISLSGWGAPARPLDLLDLKGVVGLLFERLGLPLKESVGDRSDRPYLAGPAVAWESDGRVIGAAGEVERAVLAAFEIPSEVPVAYAELDLEQVMETGSGPVRVGALSKIAPVARDLAIVVAEEVQHRAVSEAIQAGGGPILKELFLFDLYRGSQVPAGKKSMAFRLLYSAGDRTLTDPEINSAHERVVQALKERFQAELR